MVAMACTFKFPNKQLTVPHKATYYTLWSLSILDWANDFYMDNEEEAMQDAIDPRAPWHHLQSVEWWF